MKELPHSVEGGLLNRVWVPGETDGSAPQKTRGRCVLPPGFAPCCPLCPALCSLIRAAELPAQVLPLLRPSLHPPPRHRVSPWHRGPSCPPSSKVGLWGLQDPRSNSAAATSQLGDLEQVTESL